MRGWFYFRLQFLSVVFKFSVDRGKAMEQVVIWELRRRGNQIYFLKNGYECDFVAVSKSGGITGVIVLKKMFLGSIHPLLYKIRPEVD